jgi:hypothetical protein
VGEKPVFLLALFSHMSPQINKPPVDETGDDIGGSIVSTKAHERLNINLYLQDTRESESTRHAKEERQLTHVPAFESTVSVELHQIMVGQVKQVLQHPWKRLRGRITVVVRESKENIGSIQRGKILIPNFCTPFATVHFF